MSLVVWKSTAVIECFLCLVIARTSINLQTNSLLLFRVRLSFKNFLWFVQEVFSWSAKFATPARWAAAPSRISPLKFAGRSAVTESVPEVAFLVHSWCSVWSLILTLNPVASSQFEFSSSEPEFLVSSLNLAGFCGTRKDFQNSPKFSLPNAADGRIWRTNGEKKTEIGLNYLLTP